MEEKVINIVKKVEALTKIKEELDIKKIICDFSDGFREDISSENFSLDMNSDYYYGIIEKEKNYDKVNIQILTKEYPHIRRRLNKFDTINGDYSKLIEKVKYIIQEDIKKKETEKIKTQKENNNLKSLKEKLKGLGARKEQYSDSYIIKNKYFNICFYADDEKVSVNIEEDDKLSLDQAIELIKKLQ